MYKTSMAGLLEGVPGTYILERETCELPEDFQRNLDDARAVCDRRGFHFRTIEDPRTGRVQAFFVHIAVEALSLKSSA